jgi:hypothetical protein
MIGILKRKLEKSLSTYLGVFTVINDFHYKLGKPNKFNDISTF